MPNERRSPSLKLVDNSKLLIYHLFRFFYHLFSLLNSIGMIHKELQVEKYNGVAFLAFPWLAETECLRI
ncbi:hypothetical protein BGV40_10470 [Methanosarcina sp. Ant1]|nr:hypothetical protein BGV40_10470 [Methanosarcina sp. Ant1]